MSAITPVNSSGTRLWWPIGARKLICRAPLASSLSRSSKTTSPVASARASAPRLTGAAGSPLESLMPPFRS